ncbi:unnamed protein product [Trichogramma brassicae]|uniref:Uncharacterized protein n=1 Tax=Trichogramma brassicae TaxID=86971 RepID=A0A6H5IRB2_9HYME|nr:unnamed protein product [Trichogramma brassicae]
MWTRARTFHRGRCDRIGPSNSSEATSLTTRRSRTPSFTATAAPSPGSSRRAAASTTRSSTESPTVRSTSQSSIRTSSSSVSCSTSAPTSTPPTSRSRRPSTWPSRCATRRWSTSSWPAVATVAAIPSPATASRTFTSPACATIGEWPTPSSRTASTPTPSWRKASTGATTCSIDRCIWPASTRISRWPSCCSSTAPTSTLGIVFSEYRCTWPVASIRAGSATRCERPIESPQDVLRLVKQEYGQVDIVRLLLRFHADVEALDANDTPPLFHAFKCDMRLLRGIVATRVASYNEDFWREVQAVFRDIQREKFFCLINADANVRYATASGKDTLLHLLIDGRRLFNQHHQSSSSSSSNNKNNKINGNNNGNYSSKERDLPDEEKAELVDTLLRYGADKDARNSAGLSALQMAVSAYLRRTVKTLLDHGANVAGVCFFHYRMPKRDPSGNFDVREMEAFLDIIALMLARKSELGANRSNELLMLRYMAVESSIRHIENCSLSELRHLLDFGDVNAMNVAFYLSERSVLSNREKIGLMLEHIRKLEVAGLHVDAVSSGSSSSARPSSTRARAAAARTRIDPSPSAAASRWPNSSSA